MPTLHGTALVGAALGALVISACGKDPVVSSTTTTTVPTSSMTVLGVGRRVMPTNAPLTAELAVLGTTAYTSTWGNDGRWIHIWDVSGNAPVLVDSVDVGVPVTTTGDVQVSDDGRLMMVATEFYGQLVLYDVSNPRHPTEVSRFRDTDTQNGVHTAKFGRVNGVLYAFLAVDALQQDRSRLVILDLSIPSAPRKVYVRLGETSFIHDTFLRNGILFLAHWNDGMILLDVGGDGKGGTISAPVEISRIVTLKGKVHNIHWLKGTDGLMRFAFIGEEGQGGVLGSSGGDVHVVDLSDIAQPREVAYFNVPGAGTHNFAVDEAHGVLYAAYYNGGVQAIDVTGDLGACAQSAKDGLLRCDLQKSGHALPSGLFTDHTYIWGVALSGGSLYASDMFGALWKLKPLR